MKGITSEDKILQLQSTLQIKYVVKTTV